MRTGAPDSTSWASRNAERRSRGPNTGWTPTGDAVSSVTLAELEEEGFMFAAPRPAFLLTASLAPGGQLGRAPFATAQNFLGGEFQTLALASCETSNPAQAP